MWGRRRRLVEISVPEGYHIAKVLRCSKAPGLWPIKWTLSIEDVMNVEAVVLHRGIAS